MDRVAERAGAGAHSFTLLHDSERAAFASQVAAHGAGTTLLVDTYDISAGINTAVEVAGTDLGAIRIDSGDVGVLARQAREQLDSLDATGTRIVVSGDLDEYAIASLRAENPSLFIPPSATGRLRSEFIRCLMTLASGGNTFFSIRTNSVADSRGVWVWLASFASTQAW